MISKHSPSYAKQEAGRRKQYNFHLFVSPILIFSPSHDDEEETGALKMISDNVITVSPLFLLLLLLLDINK